MGILKILFTVSIFSLCLGQLVRFDFRNGIAFTATDISIGFCFLYWLGYVLIRKKIKIYKNDSIFRAIFIFILVCISSLIINAFRFSLIELGISSLYLLRWIAYASIYAIVQGFDDKFRKRIPLFLLMAGTLTVFFGYLQFIYYNNLKNLFYLGWDDHMYRVFSVFLDPNFVGAYFVLLALITLLHISAPFALVVLVFTIMAIFLTHSRSTLVMFFVSGIVFSLLINKKRLIIILALLILVVTMIFSSQFYIENINLFRIVSTKARLETTDKALKTIRDNPILGVGFNTYRYYQIQQGYRVGPGAIYSHSDAGTDNSILFVLATTGILGGFAYLNIWRNVVKRAWNQYKTANKSERIMAVIVMSSVVGLFSHSLFVNSLFYPFLMLWIWTLCGLLSTKNIKESR